MNKKPLISVILPVYNAQNFIKESVASILSQSYNNFELIIINDCSFDQTFSILKSIKDERIKLINNSHNLGVSKTLNIGLKHAQGKYIARCDADDINLPGRFKKQVDFLNKHPGYCLVGSKAIWIDKDGKELDFNYPLVFKDPQIRKNIFVRNPFIHPSVMFRTNLIKELGGYNNFFNGAEDYDLWFKMIRKGKVFNFKEPLIKRRVHEDVITQKKHIKIEFLALIVRIINLPYYLNL